MLHTARSLYRARLAAPALLVFALAAAASPAALTAPAATASPAAAAAPTAIAVPSPAPPAVASPAGDERAPDLFRARCDTSRGSFVVEVHRDWAPRGADRFHHLIAAGYFDDSRFFRVVAGYIAQFGIAGSPAVAAAWKDRPFADDPAPGHTNTRGTFAFAMTGPDTRTTQIYINLKDNPQLDGQGFTPLGQVTSGMDVVDRLYSGYGESAGGGMRGGKQGRMLAGGNAYLDAQFPRLDPLIRLSFLEGTR
jgi:cyclophilin family peptidyl-prolyl cis-trans isomerase